MFFRFLAKGPPRAQGETPKPLLWPWRSTLCILVFITHMAYRHRFSSLVDKPHCASDWWDHSIPKLKIAYATCINTISHHCREHAGVAMNMIVERTS